MKLGKSKLALAKVINENGGWVDDSANWAVQPKHGSGDVWFSTSTNKPYSPSGGLGFTFKGQGRWLGVVAKFDKVLPNWHQCVLSREEYYHAYPKADADGWIEWSGGECPVDGDSIVDVEFNSGNIVSCVTKGLSWRHEWTYSNVIAYRLHKPDVKPEFCESVTSGIPEPVAYEKLSQDAAEAAKVALMSESIEESKRRPTIEQLAQDYRNAKDHADRLQKEADTAKDKSEEIKVALINAGADIGIVISIARDGNELEYKIGEKWFLVSDLKAAGWTDLQLSDYQSR